MRSSSNLGRAPVDDRARVDDQAPVDVLAAERFGVPAPDAALHHEALRLPPDMIGEEPHEVLAAEEFAMPAPDARHPVLYRPQHPARSALRAVGALVPMMALWLWRRRRRVRG